MNGGKNLEVGNIVQLKRKGVVDYLKDVTVVDVDPVGYEGTHVFGWLVNNHGVGRLSYVYTKTGSNEVDESSDVPRVVYNDPLGTKRIPFKHIRETKDKKYLEIIRNALGYF